MQIVSRLLIVVFFVFSSIFHSGTSAPQGRILNPNFRLRQGFQSAFLAKPRELLVWLPPGYDANTEKRYSVLYMHDGTNAFILWRIDEIAEKLIAAKEIEPIIIVGVPHGGTVEGRFDDLTPTRAMGRGGKADLYGRMLVEELKPFIDAEYRTLPDAAHTGLGGSSLGGLASLYLGIKYPDKFGNLAVMSPSVWWDNKVIVRNVKSLPSKQPLRIWLDVGTEEGMTPPVKELRDALVKKGWVPNADLIYLEAKGAGHTDQAWKQRFGQVLKYLFPASKS